MRRLMTGYAVTFNGRHRRRGHLFQNRYKSVICDEDPYLLELIRYIHLNPLRVNLVKDLKELDYYPWTGHSAILGRRKNPLILNPPNGLNQPEKSLAEKTIEDVLLHFGGTKKVARRRYRQFVKKGIGHGKRPELQGGGLVRSAGGDKMGLLGRKKEEREKGEARILGSGDFVVQALKAAGELHERSMNYRISLDKLIKRVCKDIRISTKDLLSSKRKLQISNTRAIISYLAAIELRYTGAKIASELRLSEKSIGKCIERGQKLLDNDKGLLEHLQ